MAQEGYDRIPVSPGRPRIQLDLRLLQELAALGWGYKRIAAEYARRTGQYVSHMTVRDRLAGPAQGHEHRVETHVGENIEQWVRTQMAAIRGD